MSSEEARVRRRLRRLVGRAIEDWKLLGEGDRVLVAMSGGKDSYVLMDLLHQLQRIAPVRYELLAFHLDQAQPGHDPEPLRTWLEDQGLPYLVERHDTWSVVQSKLAPEETPCSLCSRLRRGILYEVAQREGCTRIALGHHRDDLVETVLLNMLFAGSIKTMPVRLRSDDGRNTVIRPLAYCEESTIARYAELRGYPILPCRVCGAREGLWRPQIKALLDELERRNPRVRQSLLASLGKVVPSHLLDRDLLERVEGTTRGFDPSLARSQALPVMGSQEP